MQRIPLTQFWNRYKNHRFETSNLAKALTRLPAVSPSGPWIAGGAIRRTIAGDALDSDFDFFFATPEQFSEFVDGLESRGARKVSENEFNVSYELPAHEGQPSLKVQAIRASYTPTLEAMLETFDFSLCQCGYDGSDMVLGEWTLYDIARKRLVPGKISYGVSSLRRMLKYTKQGYTVCSGGLSSLLEQVVQNPSIINGNVVSLD